jgi:hypothetical protein
MRILVTRTDRLGDVILSTPVLVKVRELYPEAKVFFLVQKSWMPVLQFGSEVELIEYNPLESLVDLSERLKTYQFDLAYVLRDESKVSRAVKRAGIPKRVGPYSSLRSFFLFNQGRLQRRSRCVMHEAEYNLDLVIPQTPSTSVEGLPQAWLSTSVESKLRAQEYLANSGLARKQFTVIHPGSSGSARYVKQGKLQALAQALIERGQKVVISGGPAETALLEEFQQAVPGVLLLGGSQGLGLDGMAEVYRLAKGVVAHGTGPLHLAAAVGTPVLAIFPPLFVLSEKRWGPLVRRRSVWVPQVSCPEKFRCAGEKCRYYDCMDLFEAAAAVITLEKLSS